MAVVIVFRGKAGVGKTAISTGVAKKLNIPLIRKDDVYDSIAFYIDNHEMRNKACFDTIFKIIQTNIENGVSVIVDAGFHQLTHASKFKSWVLENNAKFLSLLCICSDELLWAERFNKRKQNPQPNNQITDFEELKKHYASLKTEPLENEAILDTVNNLDLLINKAIHEINTVVV
jgi:predicted kinase